MANDIEQFSVIYWPFICIVLQNTAFMENSMEFPQKQEIDISYDLAMSLVDMYLKDMNSAYQRDTCASMFVLALFTTVSI
jgi:hypothetical protein